MSELLKLIRENLKKAMTLEVELRKQGITDGSRFDNVTADKTVSRAIISMFPEIGKKPADATDDDVIKLLKKYIGQEKERAVYQLGYLKEEHVKGKSSSDVKKLVNAIILELGDVLISRKILIAKMYLPKQPSEEEIVAWIKDNNLDVSCIKKKMKAMGPIMQEFKGADGNFVKSILMNL